MMKKFSLWGLLITLVVVPAWGAPFKTVLLTGGNGYIGSHIAVELLKENYQVVIIDNLANSKSIVKDRILALAPRESHLDVYHADLKDSEKLNQIFDHHSIDAVIHLAGLKAVGESVKNPLKYYDNNIRSTLTLLQVMEEHHCNNLVFSSSATVYGVPEGNPIHEGFPLSATNAYGRTKLQIEEILGDLAKADAIQGKKNWRMISLRYFNPVGSHESGLLGEDPHGIPNNLMPVILQVLTGKRERIDIFGGDYATRDGTGVRDFIHVVDLAHGHLATLHKLEEDPTYWGSKAYNLGSGRGYSVLEMIQAVENETGQSIPYRIVERRPGDAGEVFADASLAEKELHWKAKLGLQEMVQDGVRWIKNNPNGYPDETVIEQEAPRKAL